MIPCTVCCCQQPYPNATPSLSAAGGTLVPTTESWFFSRNMIIRTNTSPPRLRSSLTGSLNEYLVGRLVSTYLQSCKRCRPRWLKVVHYQPAPNCRWMCRWRVGCWLHIASSRRVTLHWFLYVQWFKPSRWFIRANCLGLVSEMKQKDTLLDMK